MIAHDLHRFAVREFPSQARDGGQVVVAQVAALNKRPFTVGFAAETHDLEAYARDKLARKKLDMIAANWVGREHGGFDSEQNALHVFWENGEKTMAMMDKTDLAEQLISLIAERFNATCAHNKS